MDPLSEPVTGEYFVRGQCPIPLPYGTKGFWELCGRSVEATHLQTTQLHLSHGQNSSHKAQPPLNKDPMASSHKPLIRSFHHVSLGMTP